MVREANWALALTCICYLGIVHLTSRGLIAAPRYRLLQARLRDCRARAGILSAVHADDPAATAALAGAIAQLDDLERDGILVWRLRPGSWVIAIPLSKLAAAWRTLHSVERQLLRVETAEGVHTHRETLRLELAASEEPGDADLATRLAPEPPAGPEARALLLAATASLHDREDSAAERDYDRQRVALWLAMAGLAMAFVTGSTVGHEQTMLLGALGGFLSPLVGVLRSQAPASWGALVLAPVGGALAALGGLLLVRLLADPELNLLGQVFFDNSWGAPTQPIALAIAMLFGFSGTLFSRLALAATGQLLPASGRTTPHVPIEQRAPTP